MTREQISIENARQYRWDEQYHGFHLLEDDCLGVIEEHMPTNTLHDYIVAI